MRRSCIHTKANCEGMAIHGPGDPEMPGPMGPDLDEAADEREEEVVEEHPASKN
jgi:hypothetical protein